MASRTLNDVTHCVIGGGVVGLAVARQLASRPNTTTVLLERHNAVGTETSSRNSEVIHAGLYYPTGSLKTALCIAGKELMYEYCKSRKVPHRNCGKWIVAQTPDQLEALYSVYSHATQHKIPMRWLDPSESKSREPNVRAEAGVLESPTTGIVDSHALMLTLLGEFEEHGGDVAFNCPVTAIRKIENGFEFTTPESRITADVVVNAAGLGAVEVANMILPEERKMKPYYCKGTYFSYSRKQPEVRTLVYPAPVKGLGGLGTHLTLDMAGRLRFGPDVEWVEDPGDLVPSTERLELAVKAIREYLPDIEEEALSPDYCGMRPKLRPQAGGGVGQVDFVIREEKGLKGLVNLLGIESPGLTSSLAIAKYVYDILYKN
ncbi:FAD dependent oxidoreductase [Ascodesmis nigricans]|uniref:L-2-hydroxyglutarate dehydrogenase, mitochondrial n=1 Tax=Ascodesmis nigricans TaxID=341454 RepID=A0A4S2MN00_9PEZI|nr:FAD dependent oxidoreductase [Ascodesmis nigricans]